MLLLLLLLLLVCDGAFEPPLATEAGVAGFISFLSFVFSGGAPGGGSN